MSLSKWVPGSHFGLYGFQTLTLLSLWISSPNFTGTSLACMGRSLLIFSNVIFKMVAWRPYWIFQFLDSNLSLALNIKCKLQWHITCVYGRKPIDFQRCHFQNGRLAAILDFSVSRLLTLIWLWISSPNFSSKLIVCMERSLLVFSNVTFKMTVWQPYWIFQFLDSNFNLALNMKSNFRSTLPVCMGW